ncbi:MAG: hypothetical protein V3U02_10265 [Calditrichia bacterium]
MLNTIQAVVRKKKIELLEKVEIPEGTRVLVTVLIDEDEPKFWQSASQLSLDRVWNNSEDDIYEQLLENRNLNCTHCQKQ